MQVNWSVSGFNLPVFDHEASPWHQQPQQRQMTSNLVDCKLSADDKPLSRSRLVFGTAGYQWGERQGNAQLE